MSADGVADAGGIAPDFEDPSIKGFTDFAGPILRKRDGSGISGFLVEDRHCNPQGICHGGWLATFADVQLVRHVLGTVDGAQFSFRTANLTIDFVGAARKGDWVQGAARIVRQAKTMVFVEGAAFVGHRQVLRMSGLMTIRPRHRPAETASHEHEV